MATDDTVRFTLPLPGPLADQVERVASSRRRSRNQQAIRLIEVGLMFVLLPRPVDNETAADYRERLQSIADGGQ